MRLFTNGREKARIPVAMPDGAALALSFDGGVSWHPGAYADGVVSALVAGPTATDNPDGTIVLAPGANRVLVRLRAAPEDVIRSAGTIFVTDTL